MRRTNKRQLAAAVTIAALIAGAVVAVAAGGQGTHRHARQARVHVSAIGPRDLAAAANYLGLSTAQLASDLQSGRSLSEVAAATPGRSPEGLSAALVGEKRTRLRTLAATLPRRVNREVNRKAGASAGAKSRGPHGPASTVPAPERLPAAAAAYLGVSPLHLEQVLRSGLTLGQLANAMPGKSSVGLVAAIVLARRERMALAVAAGRLSPEQASLLGARLVNRVTVAVNRRAMR